MRSPAESRAGQHYPLYSSSMSSDAYSPLTGAWGVEGIWDLYFGGLAVATLGLALLCVGTTRRSRIAGVVGILAVGPTYAAVRWLSEVSIATPADPQTYCLLRGPVDAGTECGSAYLTRYWSAAFPIAVALCLQLAFLIVQTRIRLAKRRSLAAA